MKIPSAFLLASTLAAAGCGGSDTNALTGSQSCTLTLSGAISATAACQAVGAYSSGSGQLGFTISLKGTPTGLQSFGFAVDLPGLSLSAATFNNGNATKAGTALVGTAATQAWAQLYNQGGADQGAWSLTLSSTGNELDSGNDRAWIAPHGSYTATLAPVAGGGATGNVTATATF